MDRQPPAARSLTRLRTWLACVPTRAAHRTRRLRFLRIVGAFLLTGGTIAVVAFGFLAIRLSQGPIELPGLTPRIAAALQGRLGPGTAFTLGSVSLDTGLHGAHLAIHDLVLRGATGRTIVAAPEAELSVDLLALASGRLAPKRLEFSKLDVRLIVQTDGTLAVSAGSEAFALTPVASADAPIGPSLLALLDLVSDPQSAIGALERIGVAQGRLVLEDRRTDLTTTFVGLDLGFDKTAAGSRLHVAADGPSGRWSADARAEGSPGQERRVRFDLRNLSPDEVGLLAGLRDPAVAIDAPLSATLDVRVAPDNQVTSGSADAVIGAGFIFAKDPDFEPLAIDKVEARLHWDAPARALVIDAATFDAGATHFNTSGLLTPPKGAGTVWRFAGQTTRPAAYGAARGREPPVPIDRGALAASFDPAVGRLSVDGISLDGPGVHVAGSAAVAFGNEPALNIDMTARRTSAVQLDQLWPSPVATEARLWFLDHLQGGTIDDATLAVRFTPADFELIAAHRSPTDGAVRLDVALSDAAATLLPGVPPLSALAGTARVTGRTAQFNATRGTIEGTGARKLSLLDGAFTAPNFDQHPAPASLTAHMSGSLDSLADLLSRDGLKRYANLPIDTVNVRGQVEGRIGVTMKMGAGADDPTIKADGTVTAFSVDKLIGKEKLDNGTVTVSLDANGLKAQGQGRMFGAPATVELRKPPTGVTEATIGVTLDDAARARQGLALGSGLIGPVGAKITAALGQTDRTKASVEVDLSRAAIDNLVPGLTKPAGKPAKATFGLAVDPTGTTLDNIVFDGGGASVRGSAQLDGSGAFSAARLSSVRLSPGDDLKVDAQQSKEGLKITVRGAVMDARPFLRGLTDGGAGQATPGPANLDLDVTSAIVTGHNKQALTNVDLKVSKRGGAIRQFSLAGRFGKQVLAGTLQRTTAGLPQVQISSGDAGALLSFLDLYKRMEGGDLLVFADIRGARLDGQVRVHDFLLHDEPALRRLVTAGAAGRSPSSGTVDPSAAAFSKLQVDFGKAGSRIDLRNGSVYGTQIGTTLEGWVDLDQSRVDLSGTFVPAYGLNNLFSKIPLVGAILGGGAHEGLLGINYRVSGPMAAPVLNINPLSVLAPGFLRRAFGAGSSSTETAAAPPSR